MSLISVQKTPCYDPALLRQAVDAHFAALRVEEDLFPGMRVLLKPNLLAGRKPEQAVTTHPALIQAVADWLRERGVETTGGFYACDLAGFILNSVEKNAMSMISVRLSHESMPE